MLNLIPRPFHNDISFLDPLLISILENLFNNKYRKHSYKIIYINNVLTGTYQAANFGLSKS